MKPLREAGRKDFHPKARIEDSMRGVTFDYYYTGRKRKADGQIELHVTSVVTNWQENVYIRRAWYLGHGKDWKETIRRFLLYHMDDLGTGIQLVQAKLSNFEASREKFVPWEKYRPEYYRKWE